MKDRIKMTFLYCLLIFSAVLICPGCSSSRKNVQSNYKQSDKENISIKGESAFDLTENSKQRTDIKEELNGSLEFTKVDFENGASLLGFSPSLEFLLNLLRQPYRDEIRKPPDSIPLNPVVKSITSGKFDFDSNSQSSIENQSKADIRLENSLDLQSDISSQIIQKEKLKEKEKHGFFYWLGIIATGVAGVLLLWGIYKVFDDLDRLKKQSK